VLFDDFFLEDAVLVPTANKEEVVFFVFFAFVLGLSADIEDEVFFFEVMPMTDEVPPFLQIEAIAMQ